VTFLALLATLGDLGGVRQKAVTNPLILSTVIRVFAVLGGFVNIAKPPKKLIWRLRAERCPDAQVRVWARKSALRPVLGLLGCQTRKSGSGPGASKKWVVWRSRTPKRRAKPVFWEGVFGALFGGFGRGRKTYSPSFGKIKPLTHQGRRP